MNDVTELDLLATLGEVDPPDQDTMAEAALLLAAETDLVGPPTRFGKRKMAIGGGWSPRRLRCSPCSAWPVRPPRRQRRASAGNDPSLREVVLAALDSHADSILHVTMTAVNKNAPEPPVADLWYSSAQPKAGQSITVRNIVEPTSSTFEQDASETYVVTSAGATPADCEVHAGPVRDPGLGHACRRLPVPRRATAGAHAGDRKGEWHRAPGADHCGWSVGDPVQHEDRSATSKGTGYSIQSLWVNASTGLPIREEEGLRGRWQDRHLPQDGKLLLPAEHRREPQEPRRADSGRLQADFAILGRAEAQPLIGDMRNPGEGPVAASPGLVWARSAGLGDLLQAARLVGVAAPGQ